MRSGAGTYASNLCAYPKMRAVRGRSQMSESNGEMSVVRWVPRIPAPSARSALGEAHASSVQPRTVTGTSFARSMAARVSGRLTPIQPK